MSVNRISSRYAKSLIDLAVERNEMETVVKDIQLFDQVAQNRDFSMMLKSPIINTSKKQSIFSAIFDGKISKTTAAFFDIILRKGRESVLADISGEFMNQYKKLNKISSVTLTTATPLNDAALNEIKTKLLASNITIDKIELNTKIDPNILGGFVIEVGDKLYDASVQHKLDQLKKEFVGNQYVKSF
jgi:F-type H+-transporting ATPase subunit delta